MTGPIETSTPRATGPALYVLQMLATELSALVRTVRSVVGEHRAIEVARNDTDGPNYEPASSDLDATLNGLKTGELAVVVLRTSQRGFRSVLFIAPNIFGGRLSQWMAAIEFSTENWRPIWEAALSERGLAVVCLTLDEALDVSDDNLSVQTFPWNESRLVAAALRDATGDWVVRENPRPSW
jgi:hypothetical protein